ncbi:fibroblast growth factor 19 [Conger conger]|uniref:fibroblast growth factor 19 n=1 Tax=Conger conger TaxID=82655 RepID=UPI002A599ABF|nr:fibroblast growth factor 19 [Conger conger]
MAKSSVGALCFPLPQAGPHIANGWGDAVRFRHLYAARQGLHLQINADGKVHGSASQSSYSLLEIRPVDTGFVAIKGVTSSKYLCMEGTGSIYGSATYVKEDCSFLERILSDGYSVYFSSKHGAPLSLSGDRQQPQLPGKAPLAPAQFLPMMSTQSLLPMNAHSGDPPSDPKQAARPSLELDSMDPYGKLSQIYIQSPSFSKR